MICEGGVWHLEADQNRITNGYDQGFVWQPNGDITSFAGSLYGYNTAQQQPPHAVNTVGGVDRYDCNLNGSMSARNKNTASSQALKWDSRNQLAQVTWGNPQQNEYYGYDENGRRIARAQVSGGATTVTFYPFAHYEQKGSSSTGITKYYFFNGERFATRTGAGVSGSLRLLFKDRISSTVHVTDQNGNLIANAGYYAFGATMRSTGAMPTDRLFTASSRTAPGCTTPEPGSIPLGLGHFISPDTLVDCATSLLYFRPPRLFGAKTTTRVWWSRSFKEDKKRWLPGPGGNLDQTCIWQERLPK